MGIRVARSGRRHRIGKAHILAAMENATHRFRQGDAYIYLGIDDRGDELLIVAVPDDRAGALPEDLTVIHAMPTRFVEKNDE